MGIRGLQTYCEEHCRDVCEPINVANLSRQYWNRTGREPVVVVDGPSCLRTIYGENDWICGGQFKQFQENCCAFVKKFRDAGIKLVFFFDGPTVDAKRETWIKRRKRAIKDIERIFDSLLQGRFRESTFSRIMQQPSGLNTYARFIFKYYCKCEVHASIKECDYEISQYAQKNSCFGILGQDTDFIILNPTENYFSAQNLIIETLDTIRYNSKALATNLNITVQHLPLFASLMGNDIITEEKLRFFHTKHCIVHSGNRFKDIAEGVARYVKQFPPVGSGLHEFIPSICLDVFNDIGMCDCLHHSIVSYLPEFTSSDSICNFGHGLGRWELLLELAARKHEDSEIPSTIYGIIRLLPFESSTYVEDFRMSDIPPSGLITRPSRERLYSFLLSECPFAKTIEEWCVTGKNSLERAFVVPVKRDVGQPSLHTLWDTKCTDSLTLKQRWDVFAWIVSPRLSAAKLCSLPPCLVVTAAVLFYLLHEVRPVFLKPNECSLFLILSICLPGFDSRALSDISVERPDPRAVRLATVFLRLAVHVFIFNGGCGYPVPVPDSLPSGYFDGKLFQHFYIKMLSGYNIVNILQNDIQRRYFTEIKNLLRL